MTIIDRERKTMIIQQLKIKGSALVLLTYAAYTIKLVILSVC